MYLMYVDESGDPGNNTKQSEFFCLSGLVVHESEWRGFIDTIRNFRRTLQTVYGFPVRTEIHAVKLIRHSAFGTPKHSRLAILRNFLDELAKLNSISITNVVVDKRGKSSDFEIFGSAWRTLFQRFENTLTHGNFPGGYRRSYGIAFTDATNGTALNRIMRKMSSYNPIPNMAQSGYRNMPITRVIEDPSERNSAHSLPIQACDVAAYFLLQRFQANSYVKKQRATKYFDRLESVLNKNAATHCSLGIVLI